VNSVVYLTGVVQTPDEKARAAQLASQASGVRQVVNNLQVQPTPAAAGASSATAASPATASGRRVLVGRVSTVDPARNQVTAVMGSEQLILQLPAGTVAGLRPGDEITVDVRPR
jgi:BON domain-containing protein